ncbi:unnamed protein product [Rhizophagus irregularis]|nr:unnamed protein product [Rhizophagus irregularis]CAB5361907.1 unnamed protein product [Rhizophagus irregularis]
MVIKEYDWCLKEISPTTLLYTKEHFSLSLLPGTLLSGKKSLILLSFPTVRHPILSSSLSVDCSFSIFLACTELSSPCLFVVSLLTMSIAVGCCEEAVEASPVEKVSPNIRDELK